MLGLLHDKEDWEVRSQIDIEVCAVEALSVVSRLSQLTNCIRGCPKPTGFIAFLKCSISYPQGSCKDVRALSLVWKEGHFTVQPKVGTVQRAQRMDETVAKALSMAKPGSWDCVQSRDLC